MLGLEASSRGPAPYAPPLYFLGPVWKCKLARQMLALGVGECGDGVL